MDGIKNQLTAEILAREYAYQASKIYGFSWDEYIETGRQLFKDLSVYNPMKLQMCLETFSNMYIIPKLQILNIKSRAHGRID